jgi:hypothetical protein
MTIWDKRPTACLPSDFMGEVSWPFIDLVVITQKLPFRPSWNYLCLLVVLR